ncbi:hypothetical protein [Haloarchaeobius sp. DT45]|uniref:hypothetical protein n=1 Tax=Haloarchaeobius sp. DT45 TaxID=3446116 RepID=UPI003F6C1BC8
MGRDGEPDYQGQTREEHVGTTESNRQQTTWSGPRTRRRFVTATAGASITLLAGCGGNGDADGPAGTAGSAANGEPADSTGFGEGGYGDGGYGL